MCEDELYILSLSRLRFSSLFVCKYFNRKEKYCLQTEITHDDFSLLDKKITFAVKQLHNIVVCLPLICVSSANIFSHGVTLYNFYRYLLIISWDCCRGLRQSELRTVMIMGSVSVYCSFVPVSFCCQSLIAKDHISIQLKDCGRCYLFIYLCTSLCLLFSKLFYSVN